MALGHKLTPLAKSFCQASSNMFFGFQFEKGYNTQKAVDYIQRSTPALHLRWKDDYHEHHTNPPPIFNLPDTFNSIRDATEFVSEYFKPDLTKNLGLIACNKNQVVLSANHSAMDAGFMKILLQNFGNVTNDLPLFIESDFVLHQEEIKAAKPSIINATNPDFHRWFPRKKPEISNALHPNDIIKVIPAKSLKCFDKKKGTPKGLLEYQYLAGYIAASAIENKVLPSIGAYTIIDMRRYLPYKPDFRNGNHVSEISPHVPVTGDMTLGEVARNIRNDLNSRIDEGEPFGSMKPEPAGDRLPGFFTIVSSIGPIKIQKPVEDIWIAVQADAKSMGSSDITSFSIVDENRNDVVFQLRYNENVVSTEEMSEYGDIIEDVLRNVPLDAKVKDVVKAMRRHLH